MSLRDGSHHHREILQFVLQDWKSAAGHFDTARSVPDAFRELAEKDL